MSAAPMQPSYARCYVCDRLMDGLSEDDCHCFHRKELAAPTQAGVVALTDAEWSNLLEDIDGIATQDGNQPLSEKALDRIKRAILFYAEAL